MEQNWARTVKDWCYFFFYFFFTKSFLSTFLVQLFVSFCCSYMPPHFTIRARAIGQVGGDLRQRLVGAPAGGVLPGACWLRETTNTGVLIHLLGSSCGPSLLPLMMAWPRVQPTSAVRAGGAPSRFTKVMLDQESASTPGQQKPLDKHNNYQKCPW